MRLGPHNARIGDLIKMAREPYRDDMASVLDEVSIGIEPSPSHDMTRIISLFEFKIYPQFEILTLKI